MVSGSGRIKKIIMNFRFQSNLIKDKENLNISRLRNEDLSQNRD